MNHSAENQIICEPYNVDRYFEVYLAFMKEIFLASQDTLTAFDEFVGRNGEKYHQRLTKWAASPKARLLHLKKGEQLIGVIECSLQKDGYGLISSLYVQPELRGQGHARLLMEKACEFFRENSLSEARLNVAKANIETIRFYRRLGWTEQGNSPYPDAIAFAKSLN